MQTNLVLVSVIGIPLFAASIYLVVLLARALLKYIRSKDVREEKQATVEL